MSLIRLTHIGICVSDWQRSLRFYRDLLGFEYLSELQIAGEPTNTLLQLNDVELRALYLERDGTRIELLHYASPGHGGDSTPRPMNRLGLTHLSMRVDNLAQTLATLEQAGVQVLAASRIDIPAFAAAAVFITDPDGTLIELVQAPGDPAQPPGA
ncbi:MAG: VOC family protein [Deltaproteobacteria bacterium]|nr:VOC family protein [Deltaproteobacteria bacterium]